MCPILPRRICRLVVTIKIFNVLQYDFFLYKFEHSCSKPAELHHICFTKNRLCNCKLICHVQSLFFIICKDVSLQMRNASAHHKKKENTRLVSTETKLIYSDPVEDLFYKKKDE